MQKSMQEYLDVLNPEQKAAVIHENNPLLILAGAGSGKTRVITTKIAYLINQKNVNPSSILSVTFTKKAANEMRERAIAIEPESSFAQIRTFHSFGSWFLRQYSDTIGVEPNFTVYDDDDMAVLIRKAVPSLSLKEANIAAKQIALAKDYCLFPEDDLSCIHSDFDLNEIYSAYQKRLAATGNVDFGDLIMLPVKVLQENPNVARYIHNRFKVIMVDEYQDSNIAQYRLLQEISGVKEKNDSYVCVVGDDDQSIYHFRGAEVQNILTFPEKFPNTDIIKLETNYRSTSKILQTASLVVKNNVDRLGKNLISARGDGKMPVLAFLPDQEGEVRFVSEVIRKSVEKGDSYSDWAILYRTNAQSLGFEKEFIHKKIPYVVVGSLKFYQREEIKDALAYLSLCANPKDEISFRRIINKPSRGIGEKTQDKILETAIRYQEDEEGQIQIVYEDLVQTAQNIASSFAKKARESIENFTKTFKTVLESFNTEQKLSDFVQRIIQDFGLDEYHKSQDEIDGTQRIANLQELVNGAAMYECSIQGLTEFLDSINLDRSMDAENTTDVNNAVTLITLHNTKGLEYKKVIITGMEEDVFPWQNKVGAELEEERRLFYVGVTRAKDELYLTSSAKRFMYGTLQFTRPSVFLKEVASSLKIIGQQPYGFGQNSGFNFYNSYSAESEDWGEKSELAQKWKKGSKVYSDDWGYGVVINRQLNGENFVIEVQFETGYKKKFLPEFNSNSITLIKD